MQNLKAVEGPWKAAQNNLVLLNPDLGGVPPSPPIESRQPKHPSYKNGRKRKILNEEKVQALAEQQRLMIRLDSEPLPRVQPAEPLFQFLPDIVRAGSRHCRR
jgi:hypothetical protein